MKVNTEKVYHCEFCKYYKTHASSVARHEKYCKENPNNKHKCFDWCEHLVKERKTIEFEDDDYCTTRTYFTCSVTGQKMYSYKAEKTQSVQIENNEIRMPIECRYFKQMNFNLITGTFEHCEDINNNVNNVF